VTRTGLTVRPADDPAEPARPIAFRPLAAADVPLMLDWLQRPHVRQWWNDGDDTPAKVAARYGCTTDATARFVLLLDGRDAGYFQYGPFGGREIGIDMFLAEPDRLSRGLGTRCLSAFVALVAARERPDAVTVDPHPSNARAVRCYEKCGFVHDPARSTATVRFMVRSLGG